jgi:hypothetical protein
MTVAMRTRTRETAIGFCSVCGIIRKDVEGVPVTDCICTAKMNHADDCMYVKAVSMWISLGMYCEKHGQDPCEECDCTCGGARG